MKLRTKNPDRSRLLTSRHRFPPAYDYIDKNGDLVHVVIKEKKLRDEPIHLPIKSG
jgi:hypothetical protein